MNRFLLFFKYGVICLIILSFSTACTKHENKDRTLYGQIRYKDSTDKPIANTSFELQTTSTVGYPSKSETNIFSFSTDVSGNFRIIYHAKDNASLVITYPGKVIADRFYSQNTNKVKWELDAGIIYAPAP